MASSFVVIAVLSTDNYHLLYYRRGGGFSYDQVQEEERTCPCGKRYRRRKV